MNNNLYRWVKASERDPAVNYNTYIVRGVNNLYPCRQMIYHFGWPPVSSISRFPKNWEWLEQLPEVQGVKESAEQVLRRYHKKIISHVSAIQEQYSREEVIDIIRFAQFTQSVPVSETEIEGYQRYFRGGWRWCSKKTYDFLVKQTTSKRVVYKKDHSLVSPKILKSVSEEEKNVYREQGWDACHDYGESYLNWLESKTSGSKEYEEPFRKKYEETPDKAEFLSSFLPKKP